MIIDRAEGLCFKLSALGLYITVHAAHVESRRSIPPDFSVVQWGYSVHIGKTDSGEIDFIASRQNDKIYVQVTQEICAEKTEKREYERLLQIKDNYPKYVLRTDAFAEGNYQEIKTMHVADFLLSEKY